MARAKVVTVMRWYTQDGVNQEESEQNEVDGMQEKAERSPCAHTQRQVRTRIA